MFDLLGAVCAGVFCGVATGITPGIHVNTVCAVLLSSTVIIPLVGVIPIICFILAMAVTHTFIDILPSVFLGAPDPSMVLSVLPGHELLHEGRGFEAVQLTQVGSLAAVALSILFFPIFLFIISWFNTAWVPTLLLGLVFFLLLQTNWKGWIIFFLAGVFGWLTFGFPGLEQPLLPLLSGLFGISTLLLAKKGVLPQQRNQPFTTNTSPLFPAQISGFLTAFMPGLGAAAAASLVAPFIRLSREGFLLMTGSIGTVNFVLSLATWFVLDKARNGAIVAIKEVAVVSFELLLLGLAVILLAAGMASLVLTYITPFFVRFVERIPYLFIARGVIVVMLGIIVLLSGVQGLIIASIGTALGVVTQLIGVPRMYLMGCISGPVLIYLLT